MSQGGFFLAIAGNIGVGKTELTTRLSQELGWVAYYEPVIQNPYLDPFYKDMPRWSFHLQIYFLSERFKAQVEISRSPLPFIQDRTIYEDAEIFAQHLYRSGRMADRDWATYRELYEAMRRSLQPPDLMIYLRCSVSAIRRRIRRRGRPSEQGIPTEYLRSLNTLYEGWIGGWTASPLLIWDSERMDYLGDLVDQLEFRRAVSRVLDGR